MGLMLFYGLSQIRHNDFYSFFRDTLKVSDTSPENVDLIQNRLYKNLPLYLAEEKKVKLLSG
jgi:hypothetical protein